MCSLISRRDLFRGAALLAPAARLFAWQQDANPPQYKGGISVVNVLVTVRDRQGKIATNLIQDDFSVEEDGHPETIRYFAKQTDLPLNLGLLVDTSQSERRELASERRASLTFFEQVLSEDKDKAFVIHFDREVELLQDLTSSKKDLEASLNDLAVPQLNRGGGGRQGGGGGGRYGSAIGTALYDAVLLASNEVIGKQQGRKALIVLSDGEDVGSKTSLSSAIEAAQRADTLVYCIRFADNSQQFVPQRGGIGGRRRGGLGGGPFPGGGGGQRRPAANREDGKKVLRQMASETGGSYFEVSNKMPLEKIYGQINDELRNLYSLGYTSDQAGPGYRKIQVSVKIKNLTAQAREGYYAR